MVLFKSTGMAVAVTFGLALTGSFWWEVAEPIRNSNWSGSGEQWLALGSLILGGCATLVAGGAALFALTKRETTESSRALRKPLTLFHLTGPQTG